MFNMGIHYSARLENGARSRFHCFFADSSHFEKKNPAEPGSNLMNPKPKTDEPEPPVQVQGLKFFEPNLRFRFGIRKFLEVCAVNQTSATLQSSRSSKTALFTMARHQLSFLKTPEFKVKS